MEDKVYYIKGSKANPKGVRQALLEVCPDAKNIDDFAYEIESYYHYVINGIIDFAFDDSHIELLKKFGTELQPKKQEKFVEKTMFKCIKKGVIYGRYCETEYFYSTIEEAMSQPNAIGYQEVKVIVKE